MQEKEKWYGIKRSPSCALSFRHCRITFLSSTAASLTRWLECTVQVARKFFTWIPATSWRKYTCLNHALHFFSRLSAMIFVVFQTLHSLLLLHFTNNFQNAFYSDIVLKWIQLVSNAFLEKDLAQVI